MDEKEHSFEGTTCPTMRGSSARGGWERLHQWLQPSKQPNVAPFGRLDGWSTGGWDPLQN